MEAALINTQTSVVENVIVVDSIDDVVEEGYILVAIPEPYTTIDGDFYVIQVINPGECKWHEVSGFTDFLGRSVLQFIRLS